MVEVFSTVIHAERASEISMMQQRRCVVRSSGTHTPSTAAAHAAPPGAADAPTVRTRARIEVYLFLAAGFSERRGSLTQNLRKINK